MNKHILWLLPASFCFAFGATAQNDDIRAYLENPEATTYRVVADIQDGLVNPVDLDFHPDESRKFELWVVDKGEFSNTMTIYDADTDNPVKEEITDGNSWHFMAQVSSIAYGDNGNWGTAQGIQDANRSGGVFTGPSLWSSDMSVYGVIGNPASQAFNGSHLDMLHQSPYGMGIAHEVDNVYWVFDGFNEHIVRYDFVQDHGPGQADHSDGIVHRYTEVQVQRDQSTNTVSRIVSSHMVLDKQTGWLYIVDTGNKRILRMDINSGTQGATLPFNQEPLADYRTIENVTWEVLVDSGLDMPSGIDISGNKVVVTDHGSNEVIMYEASPAGLAELGRVSPPDAVGLMGVKIGPDGQIWYVDRDAREIVHMQNENVTFVFDPENPDHINNYPTATEDDAANTIEVSVYPNPSAGQISVAVTGDQELQSIRLLDQVGKVVFSQQLNGQQVQDLDLSNLAAGLYNAEINGTLGTTTKQLVIK